MAALKLHIATGQGMSIYFPGANCLFVLRQVYLRNLGIDQSPSSILTPFMPRGPVREIELSPTELRTLKASTDPLMQRLQSSEGIAGNASAPLLVGGGSLASPVCHNGYIETLGSEIIYLRGLFVGGEQQRMILLV